MVQCASHEAGRENEKASFRLFRYNMRCQPTKERDGRQGHGGDGEGMGRRSLSGLTLPRVADDGRMRAFVTFRDAERFVSDDAGTARRAKRRGRGAVTGETEMEIRRVVG